MRNAIGALRFAQLDQGPTRDDGVGSYDFSRARSLDSRTTVMRDDNVRLRRRRCVYAAALLAAAGCTTTVVEPFYRPESAQIEQSYRRVGADFAKYARLLPTPLEIYYPENVPQPSDADLNRLRVYFRDALLAALGDDYRITYEPARDALRVRAKVIDLKITGAAGSYDPGGRLRSLVAAGELTFLMELEDSLTNQVLARAGDSTAAAGSPAGDDAPWNEVQMAAERWAALFRGWLDLNLPQARRE
jgi:hypothetical protein